MKSFRDSIEDDLAKVFHLGDEFSEEKTFYLGKEKYTAQVITDKEELTTLKNAEERHGGAGGIYGGDTRMYIYDAENENENGKKFRPRKGQILDDGGDLYYVEKASYEMGEWVLDLRSEKE